MTGSSGLVSIMFFFSGMTGGFHAVLNNDDVEEEGGEGCIILTCVCACVCVCVCVETVEMKSFNCSFSGISLRVESHWE